VLPKAAKLAEPSVHLSKRRSVHGINTARSINANSGKSGLAQNLQVLGHGCLRNAELPLDRYDDVAGTALASREKLENAASNRVA
jgi:hypothetical protein